MSAESSSAVASSVPSSPQPPQPSSAWGLVWASEPDIPSFPSSSDEGLESSSQPSSAKGVSGPVEPSSTESLQSPQPSSDEGLASSVPVESSPQSPQPSSAAGLEASSAEGVSGSVEPSSAESSQSLQPSSAWGLVSSSELGVSSFPPSSDEGLASSASVESSPQSPQPSSAAGLDASLVEGASGPAEPSSAESPQPSQPSSPEGLADVSGLAESSLRPSSSVAVESPSAACGSLQSSQSSARGAEAGFGVSGEGEAPVLDASISFFRRFAPALRLSAQGLNGMP